MCGRLVVVLSGGGNGVVASLMVAALHGCPSGLV